MIWYSVIAVGTGAALGALLRWVLGLLFNACFPAIPPGTLLANLIGAYFIGIAMAFFAQTPEIAPEWRLFVITGFMGGLTTFSTFSAEVIVLLQEGRLGWAALATAAHVGGSLLMALLGLITMHYLRAHG